MPFFDFFSKLRPGGRADPFAGTGGGDFYDLKDEELKDYSPKTLSRLCDTRDLELSPIRIADGIALFQGGRLAAALLVGTGNFSLSGETEVAQVIGGFHAVLCRLTTAEIQFKVRMVEAGLEPLAQQIDYALSGNTSAALHRVALGQKQFLAELAGTEELVERRNYAILSVTSPRLAEMEEAYRRETGLPGPLFSGVSLKTQAPLLQTPKPGHKKANLSLKEQRQGQRNLENRREEMEQAMYEEYKRSLQLLRRDQELLVVGLSALGLNITPLPDWEFTALFAEYLRPELADEVRRTDSLRSRRMSIRPQPPFSLSGFVGAQSQLVVASNLPDNSAFWEGRQIAGTALERVATVNAVPPPSPAPDQQPYRPMGGRGPYSKKYSAGRSPAGKGKPG